DLDPAFRSPAARMTARVEELESFPAFAANQLLAPMQKVNGLVKQLQRRRSVPLPADAEICVHEIEDLCTQMNRRIDALLKLSEAGRTSPEWETLMVEEIVKQYWAELTKHAPETHYQFGM